MSNLAAALRAELQQLDADLRKDPRYQRLRMVRELLAEYEPGAAVPPTVLGILGAPSSSGQGRPPGAPTTKRGKIVAEISTFLRVNGATHRTAILEHVKAKGLMGKEANPLHALAIYLSEAKIFGNDGNGNWFLKPASG